MNTTSPQHRLTQVEMERRTAVCSVCGPIPIYIARPDRRGRVRIYCLPRRREVVNKSLHKRRQQKRLQDPNRKPRHKLTDVDSEKMMAVCAVCGPTDIRKRIQNGHTVYICNTYKRAYAHEYKISHHIPKPRNLGGYQPRAEKSEGLPRKPYKPRQFGHVLSEIDDEKKIAICLTCGRVRITVVRSNGKIFRRCGKAQNEYQNDLHKRNREFIFRHLVERGCKRCGYHADPYKLELHNCNLPEKNLKLSRLVVLGGNHLLQVLASSDVYCTDCHYLLHHGLDLE